jgi:soluble lytic murein transglycosylase-like protein
MRTFGGLVLGALLLSCAAVAFAAKPLVGSSPEEYGRLCREWKALTGRSVEEIRSSLPSLGGKYVELRGKVLGKAHGDLSQSGLVDMYLRCGDDSCFVACPPDVSELQPGRCVRVIVQVPHDASDIDDCAVKAVMDDPLGYEREKPAPPQTGTQRLEIGEAAYGVRDQAANPGTGAPAPRMMTQPPAPGFQPAPAGAAPGAALPPEMRSMPSLSGIRGTQASAPPRNTPQGPPANSTAAYERAVAIWTKWVRGYNSSLTVQQADLIVRWTLHYAAANKVDHRLVFSVMKYESDFNPRCVSHVGAMGLMQLMPCNVTDFKVKDPFDIAENIRGGIEHLAEFLYKYQGKSNYEQTVLALACYNAGPGAVARYGGVPPYNETQSYVRKVPALFAQLVKDGYP